MMLVRVGGVGVTGALATLAEPWAKVYGAHKSVSAAVTFLHLVPLIFAGGAAFTADRATLRAVRAGVADRTRQLQELALTHRVVQAGLALSIVSGVLLFLSDVETFLGSVFLWIKLGLVSLLLVNGFVMDRTERALNGSGDDPALWGRLRTLAILSAILWMATALAGIVLKEFA